MDQNEFNEDPAPDFTEEQWVSSEVADAVNQLVDVLYSAGCSVNGIKITIPAIPGEDSFVDSDYGRVTLEASTEGI